MKKKLSAALNLLMLIGGAGLSLYSAFAAGENAATKRFETCENAEPIFSITSGKTGVFAYGCADGRMRVFDYEKYPKSNDPFGLRGNGGEVR